MMGYAETSAEQWLSAWAHDPHKMASARCCQHAMGSDCPAALTWWGAAAGGPCADSCDHCCASWAAVWGSAHLVVLGVAHECLACCRPAAQSCLLRAWVGDRSALCHRLRCMHMHA